MCLHFHSVDPHCLVALWFCGAVGGGDTKEVCREGVRATKGQHGHGGAPAARGTPMTSVLQAMQQTVTDNLFCAQPCARF